MPNGGFNLYPRRTTTKLFAHPYPEARTITGRVASGNVIKAHTWLERNQVGELIPHSGLTVATNFLFNGIAGASDTVTITIAGTPYVGTVPTGATPTAAQIVAAITSPGGAGIPTILVFTTPLPISATYAVGTSPEGLVVSSKNLDTALAIAVTENSGLTLAAGSVSTGTSSGYLTRKPLAGLLMYDVNATSAAVDAQVYVSGSYWADGVKWRTDPTDTVADPITGVGVPPTAYETGCTSDLHYQAFVESTEFNIVTQHVGEQEI